MQFKNPVKDRSNALIKDIYTRTSGRIPIIGVGGIENGADAYE
jgi:dihydroorotate dehydrogenase